MAGPLVGATPVASLQWRQRATAVGRIRSVRVQPMAGIPTVQCTLVDDTGGLLIVFFGRRRIAGVRPGSRMVVEGMVGAQFHRLAILNPRFELLSPE
ncbi:MAG TPA: OB-fold nucleic acid binding domain-containing protein [Acidimicrobiales bacterium]